MDDRRPHIAAPLNDSLALRLAAVFVIVLAGIACYANTLHSPFVFDDFPHIVRNTAIRDLGDLGILFQFNRTRFFGLVTFAMNYRIGGLDVAGYHVVNIAIHLMAALMVWWLVRLVLKTPAAMDTRIGAHASAVAFGCGLLFAVHPIQTQAVTYLVQRYASLAALFYFAAMACYLAGRLATSRLRSRLLFATAVLSGFAGMLTKENVVTLPIMVIVTENMLFRTGVTIRHWIDKRWMVVAAFMGIILVPLLVASTGNLFLRTTISDRPGDPLLTNGIYLLTQFGVILRYLRLLILPFGQNLDHDIPAVTSLADPAAFVPLAVLLVLGGVAFLAGRKNRIIGWGVVWFIVTISVESSIILLRNVMFEHRLYLPFTGFVLVAMVLLSEALHTRPTRVFLAVIILVSAMLGVMTWRRNAVWRDGITLWSDVVVKSPGKSRPWNNLGEARRQAGDMSSAKKDFEQALATDSRNVEAMNNLATLAFARGEVDSAEVYLRRALGIRPGSVETWSNLGTVLIVRGDLIGAVDALNRALVREKDQPEAANNLAWIRATASEANLRNAAEAVSLAELACRYTDHRNPLYLDTLAAAYAEAGRFDDARAMVNRALELVRTPEEQAAIPGMRLRKSSYERGEPWRDQAVLPDVTGELQ